MKFLDLCEYLDLGLTRRCGWLFGAPDSIGPNSKFCIGVGDLTRFAGTTWVRRANTASPLRRLIYCSISFRLSEPPGNPQQPRPPEEAGHAGSAAGSSPSTSETRQHLPFFFFFNPCPFPGGA